MKSSRREFLKNSSLLAASTFLLPRSLFSDENRLSDAAVCKTKFSLAKTQGLAGKPIGDVMAAIGLSFQQAPYKANTLDAGDTEQLVINLREFDCVTFVEATLALSRCVKLGTTSFDAFKEQLQLIRYRDGKIGGYPSRLHYFTDWIDENEKKGIVKNVARDLGGAPFEKTIDFMSTHSSSYKHLKNNEQNLQAIVAKESELNLRSHYYLPKDRVQDAREQIEDGDIIGITTNVGGLDIAHTGIAVRFMGYLRLLHAPLSGGSVQITKRTIVDYLGQEEGRTGIMIARPVDPSI